MKTSYFALTYGLAGCYMPDSDFGAYAIHRRKDLVAILRDALAAYDMPASCLKQVRILRLWRHTKLHGLSSVSFSLSHKGNELMFHGWTKTEYDENQACYND